MIKSFSDLKKVLKDNYTYILVLIILCFGTYFNSLKGGFLSADDITGYITNETTKGIGESLLSFKLNTIYYAIFYKLFGINPFPLHLTSVLLHFINTTLAFLVAYILFGKKVAFLSSVIFAVHAVNAEAVSWISANGYLFQALFFFINLLTFLIYLNSKNKKYLYVSIGLYVAEIILLRTPWVFVVPMMFWVIEFLVIGTKGSVKVFFKYLAYIIPSILLIFFLRAEFGARYRDHVIISDITYPVLPKYSYVISSVPRYYFYPMNLTIYHEGEVNTSEQYRVMFFASILILFTLFVFLKKNPQIGGLMLALYVGIAPSLSPVKLTWLVAERYMYLGGIFFCILLVKLFLFLEKEFKLKHLAVVLVIAVSLLLGIRTVIRNNDYKDDVTFWLATEKTSPLSIRTYNNLGNAYMLRGEYDRAIHYFGVALSYSPEYKEVIHNLGNIYFYKGEYATAEELYYKVLEIDENFYMTLFMLGNVEYTKGNIDGAREFILKSLEIAPNYTIAIQALEKLK